jgi:hypothetical protein
MTQRLKGALVYVAGLGLLALAVKLSWNASFVEAWHRLTIRAWIVSIVWAQVIFFLSGLQYSLMCRAASGRKLKLAEKAWLPVAVNLWSFLIPIQGGTIYSTYYFRSQFGITVAGALSLSLMLYIITLFLSGVVALLAASTADSSVHLAFWIAAIACALAPLAISPVLGFLSLLQKRARGRALVGAVDFARRLSQALRNLIYDYRSSLPLVGLNIVHMIVSAGWYFWIAWELGLAVTPIQATLLILVMRLSIVFRFTPGNLGVEQLVSAGILAAFGARPEDGVFLSLVATVTSIVLMLVAGIPFTLAHVRKGSGFSSLWRSSQTEQAKPPVT